MGEVKEQRKASDILLALETKVDNLVKIVSLYDMNIKLILDRVNKMHSYINMLQQEMLQEQIQTIPEDKRIIQSPTENLMTTEENPKGHRRVARTETYTQQPPITPPQQQKQPNTDSERKVPVVQRVTDHTGKDLFMAEVSILNTDKELAAKTKTNAAGKWQAYLKPGSYSVNIVKTDTQTKNKIEAMQDIMVGDSNNAITLPVMVIKR